MAWYGPAGSGKVRHSSTVWSGVDRRGGVGPGMARQRLYKRILHVRKEVSMKTQIKPVVPCASNLNPDQYEDSNYSWVESVGYTKEPFATKGVDTQKGYSLRVNRTEFLLNEFPDEKRVMPDDLAWAFTEVRYQAGRVLHRWSEKVRSVSWDEDIDWGPCLCIKLETRDIYLYINTRRLDMLHHRNGLTMLDALMDPCDPEAWTTPACDGGGKNCESRVIRQISSHPYAEK